jgi:hypothetical protein
LALVSRKALPLLLDYEFERLVMAVIRGIVARMAESLLNY